MQTDPAVSAGVAGSPGNTGEFPKFLGPVPVPALAGRLSVPLRAQDQHAVGVCDPATVSFPAWPVSRSARGHSHDSPRHARGNNVSVPTTCLNSSSSSCSNTGPENSYRSSPASSVRTVNPSEHPEPGKGPVGITGVRSEASGALPDSSATRQETTARGQAERSRRGGHRVHPRTGKHSATLQGRSVSTRHTLRERMASRRCPLPGFSQQAYYDPAVKAVLTAFMFPNETDLFTH